MPECLRVLNQVEVAAISLIKTHLRIYKRQHGNLGLSGNCISFAQDIHEFAKTLPRAVNDLPIVLVKSVKDKERKFLANGKKN